METTAQGVRVTQVHPSQHELISGEIRRGDMIASVSDEAGIRVIEDHMDWRDVRRMLAGPYDSTVDLQVRRDDSPETQPVSLRRRRETELPLDQTSHLHLMGHRSCWLVCKVLLGCR